MVVRGSTAGVGCVGAERPENLEGVGMAQGSPAHGGGERAGRAARWVTWLLCSLCIAWAGSSASLLAFAPSRTEAAWVVPLAWAWGATALAAALVGRRMRAPWWAIVFVAVLIRALFIGSPPLLSDDLFRYLWEGELLTTGGNPFLSSAAELVGFDDPLRVRVNHPEVRSAYPPIALLWFRWLWAMGGTVWTTQAWTAAVDVSVVGALLRFTRGGTTWPAMLYALHPLAVLESASSAHMDLPAIALLAWALVAAPRASVLLATLGAGVKLLPALVLPALLWSAGWRRLWPGLILGTALIVLAALPVLPAGWALLDGITNYATHWSFNGLVFEPLTLLVDPPNARRILVPVAGIGVTGLAIRFREHPMALWLGVGATFVALSPTMHPWYGLWMLAPALALRRWSGAVVGTSLLGAYGVLSGYDAATGAWSEPTWLWPVTWLPALVAVGIELALEVRRRRDSQSA